MRMPTSFPSRRVSWSEPLVQPEGCVVPGHALARQDEVVVRFAPAVDRGLQIQGRDRPALTDDVQSDHRLLRTPWAVTPRSTWKRASTSVSTSGRWAVTSVVMVMDWLTT